MKQILSALILVFVIVVIVCAGFIALFYYFFAGSGCKTTITHVQSGAAFIQSDLPELERVAALYELYPGLQTILVRERHIDELGSNLPVPIPKVIDDPRPDDLLIPPTALLRSALNKELHEVASFLSRHGIHRASEDHDHLILCWRSTGLMIAGSSISLERHPGGTPPHGTQVKGFAYPDWCHGIGKFECRWMHVIDDWYIVVNWS